MTSATERRPWRGRLLVLAGIALVALNFRTAVGGFSPIAGLVSRDIPVDPLLLGVIGAVPPLAFAAGGVLGPLLARRLRLEPALVVAIAALIVGHLGRALAPDATVLVVATVLNLLGVGVGNVLLPPIVKRYFPDRIGLLTAGYVTIMSIGATIPPFVAVPVASALGWRASLGVWFLLSLTAAVPWVLELLRRRGSPQPMDVAEREAEETDAGLTRRLFRSPMAWSMALFFGATAIGAYGAFGTFPAILVDTAGATPAEAGALLGVFSVMGFPLGLIVPGLAARLRSIVPLLVAGMLFWVAGLLGLLLAPATATVLWMVFTGLGPLLFPLGLVLVNLRSRTHAGSVALSGFMQGIGYLLGGTGPLVMGVLHSVTGGWTASLIFLLAVLVLIVPAIVLLRKPRFIEDEVASHRGHERGAMDQGRGADERPVAG